jgi:hypothetical protein
MSDLGRLTPVSLREFWTDESREFTPWLAKEENLKMLGDTIGIELEYEAQEKDVGPFRADILCKNTLDGSWVLIENQIEKTDHMHLGQLLTYAAGLEAVTIIWIAAKFIEEHRAALDWLNEKTDGRINFFGLEVELWRIGNSSIAPKFNVVSKPNDWSKTVTEAASRINLTDTKQLQLEFWTKFSEYVQNNSKLLTPQKPLPQNWTNMAIGRSNFYLVATCNTWDKQITAYLCLAGPDAKPHFYLLQKNKEAIERELGSAIDWRELPEKKESHLTFRKSADPTDHATWPDQHKWLTEQLERLHRVLSGRIKSLNAADYKPAQS